MFASRLLIALVAISSVLADPVLREKEVRFVGRTQPTKRAVDAPELQVLFDGNKKFKETMEAEKPGLVQQLATEGQEPPFMFIGCSDSRVNEATIFGADPGTFFSERNIANQFHRTDASAHTVLSYAVTVLGVKHVIVMGHYGCGGVAASIATPHQAPVEAAFSEVDDWIQPVRELFQTSSRPEIVELREKNKGLEVVEEPENSDPGFRALVEENVKANVQTIATSSVFANHNQQLAAQGNGTALPARADHAAATLHPAYIHGFVYDIDNGEIRDLGVSVGPPGHEIPAIPFEVVEGAKDAAQVQHGIEQPAPEEMPEVKEEAPAAPEAPPPVDSASQAAHDSPLARCKNECQAKRSFPLNPR